ncbi:hypothetical protein ISN45_At03g028120 [Arabidopsis thaliana x Arabidopsis arenosa]|uniref:Uncharacterized protein n=1 Tax=Arabidopsis thaliana x Arabidopsis arenosa TaxID=1240361 RepID=A0A8T2ER72_9BRAS|nr:hypothetical protein ISN45_At03g028120 [Arabidopsis thaliana x Arabidopsis arenosa]
MIKNKSKSCIIEKVVSLERVFEEDERRRRGRSDVFQLYKLKVSYIEEKNKKGNCESPLTLSCFASAQI